MPPKKRKSAAATTPTTPPSAKKQQKSQEPEEKPPVIEEKLPEPELDLELELEEVEEEVEEEIEGSEEEIEEEEEEEEVEEEDAASDNDDEDPIPTLIEPFTKDQLAVIVREAAEKHADVADRVRKLADQDTVHRKIFIHGLGWDTTTETLISVFKDYGEIEDCKAVTDKNTGKSKGYGFILFKTRAGARKALKEPQKTVSGRTASCQLAAMGPVGGTSGGGTSGGNTGGLSGMGGYQTEYTQRKIYISNVGPELDPGKLMKYFAKYGEIEEGPLGIDKGTGKFKGFCLFVYKTVESARKALEEPHKTYEGLTLHCQRAIDGPKPGKGSGSGGGHGTGSGMGSYHGGHGRGGGYVRGENPIVGPSVSGPGLGMGGGGLNPALGQALTALLASQGAGLGLNNLLGTLGGGGQMGGGGGYGGPGGIVPGAIGLAGYASGAAGYPSTQLGQGGGPGRSHQHGYNGTPYGGHR